MSWDIFSKSKIQYFLEKLKDKFVQKETGKGLSTNDYDNTAKGIVDGVTAALADKVDKETGKGLSTNDYTTAEKNKVATIDNKADKVSGATNGNLAGLNGSGNLTDSGWNGAKDTTSISGNPISIPNLKANQLAINPIITFEPIQAGSGTPSPSNIRAISGYDKVEVLSCGKNIWDEQWEVGTYDQTTGNPVATSSNIRSKSTNPIIVGGDTTYYWNCKNGCRAFFYDGKGNYLGNQAISNAYSTFTTPTNASYMRFHVAGEYGTTYGNNIAVNYPSTIHDYVPYVKATDISESLGQTVYWGELDVRTGKFDVLGAALDLGSLTWSYWQNNCFYAEEAALNNYAYKNDLRAVCEVYDYTGTTTGISTLSGSAEVKLYVAATNRHIIYVRDTRFTDATQLKTALNGVKIVYELQNPTTIQLTPREISLLKDYAYVSTNGTSIALDYHNGELASLADVSQLGETVNELGAKVLSFVRLSYSFGTVTNGTRYTFEVTNNYSYLNRNTVKAITIYSVKGSSGADAEGIYNQNFGIGDPNKLFINYNCKMSQSNAVMEVDILYLA